MDGLIGDSVEMCPNVIWTPLDKNFNIFKFVHSQQICHICAVSQKLSTKCLKFFVMSYNYPKWTIKTENWQAFHLIDHYIKTFWCQS